MNPNITRQPLPVPQREINPILLNTIAQQLKLRTGLDSQSLDLWGALTRRMKCSGVSTLAQYLSRLQTSMDEWQALIEAIVIPETGFFRDRQPFEYLTEWVRVNWVKRRSPMLRVLSLPCSTGQEAYSIAMTLLSAGLNPAQMTIDGIDISNRSITLAKSGQYRSITHVSQDCSSYWNPLPTGLEILPWVRQLVNFRVGNGLTVLAQSTALPYDIIFCRNLLIYFDVTHRQKLLQDIHRHLSPQGLFVVGHSEMGMIDRDRFNPVSHPQSCAFYPVTGKKLRSGMPSGIYATALTTTPTTIPATSLLARSRQLADEGDLVGAIEVCDAYMLQMPLCAEGYLLAAQVNLGLGHLAIAERFLDRAIYLEPLHPDALLQLQLLRSGRGDREGSEAIKRRLNRLQPSPTPPRNEFQGGVGLES
jgi:chemotaxis protein methyltransferase WspC